MVQFRLRLGSWSTRRICRDGSVVELVIGNDSVGGSIPPPGSKRAKQVDKKRRESDSRPGLKIAWLVGYEEGRFYESGWSFKYSSMRSTRLRKSRYSWSK